MCYLAHEARDDAVEDGALVAKALLTSAQGAEVLSSLGHNVGPELWKHKTVCQFALPSATCERTQTTATEEDFVLFVQLCLDVGEPST